MNIKANIITFKSRPEFFNKEESGIKNNTVRYLSDEEARKVDRVQCLFSEVLIQITNTETGDSFRRVIRDISTNEDVTVFTWDLEEESEV